jgi:hypothetical protein
MLGPFLAPPCVPTCRASSYLPDLLYEYDCPAGYGRHEDQGGYYCHDINECGDAHICNLDIQGPEGEETRCVNTVGSFYCQYPPEPDVPAGMAPALTLSASMDMPAANFTAPARQRFRDAVAAASGVSSDDVTILSVTSTSSRRRHLLQAEGTAGGITITFQVRVRFEETGCGYWCTYNLVTNNLNEELGKPAMVLDGERAVMVSLRPVEFVGEPDMVLVGMQCAPGSVLEPTSACGVSVTCSGECAAYSSVCSSVDKALGSQSLDTQLATGVRPPSCTWLVETDRTSEACTGASLNVRFNNVDMQTRAFKKYRFHMLELHNRQVIWGGLAEIRLYDGLGRQFRLCSDMSNSSWQPCILSVSNPGGDSQAGEGATYAYDGNPSTRWLTRWLDSPLVFEFNMSAIVSSYEWVTASGDHDNTMGGNPVSWTLEAYASPQLEQWEVLGHIEKYSVPATRNSTVGPFSAFGHSTFDRTQSPMDIAQPGADSFVSVYSCASVERNSSGEHNGTSCKARRHLTTLAGTITTEDAASLMQKVISSMTGVLEIVWRSGNSTLATGT